MDRVALFQFFVLGALAKHAGASDTLRYANVIRSWLEKDVFGNRQRVRLSSEREGWVTGRDMSFGKMKMTCYTLTPTGREEFRKQCADIRQLVDEVQHLLGAGLAGLEQHDDDR